jgi:hypothetical protein
VSNRSGEEAGGDVMQELEKFVQPKKKKRGKFSMAGSDDVYEMCNDFLDELDHLDAQLEKRQARKESGDSNRKLPIAQAKQIHVEPPSPINQDQQQQQSKLNKENHILYTAKSQKVESAAILNVKAKAPAKFDLEDEIDD